MISREDGRLMVQGDLTIATVPALFEAGLQHLVREDLLVDLSPVGAVDSAAVSMLLGWARAAQSGRRELRVINPPDNLLKLARLYGVDELLPRQSAEGQI